MNQLCSLHSKGPVNLRLARGSGDLRSLTECASDLTSLTDGTGDLKSPRRSEIAPSVYKFKVLVFAREIIASAETSCQGRGS